MVVVEVERLRALAGIPAERLYVRASLRGPSSIAAPRAARTSAVALVGRIARWGEVLTFDASEVVVGWRVQFALVAEAARAVAVAAVALDALLTTRGGVRRSLGMLSGTRAVAELDVVVSVFEDFSSSKNKLLSASPGRVYLRLDDHPNAVVRASLLGTGRCTDVRGGGGSFVASSSVDVDVLQFTVLPDGPSTSLNLAAILLRGDSSFVHLLGVDLAVRVAVVLREEEARLPSSKKTRAVRASVIGDGRVSLARDCDDHPVVLDSEIEVEPNVPLRVEYGEETFVVPLDALAQLGGTATLELARAVHLCLSAAGQDELKETTFSSGGWLHVCAWRARLARRQSKKSRGCRLSARIMSGVFVDAAPLGPVVVEGGVVEGNDVRSNIPSTLVVPLGGEIDERTTPLLRLELLAHNDKDDVMVVGKTWIPLVPSLLCGDVVNLRLGLYDDDDDDDRGTGTTKKCADLLLRAHAIPASTVLADMLLPAAFRPFKPVLAVGVSAARYLQHPDQPRGRLEPFVEASLSSSDGGGVVVVVQGAIAPAGTDTHPMWPGHIIRVPLGSTQLFDEEMVLSLAVRASTMAPAESVVGAATVTLSSVLNLSDTWLALVDARGCNRGEVCVSCSRERIVDHRTKGLAVVSVSLPRNRADDARRGKIKRYVRVTPSCLAQNLELPQQIVVAVPKYRPPQDVTLRLTNEAAAVIAELDAREVVESAVARPGKVSSRAHEALCDLEAVFVPHTQGYLSVTLVDAALEEAAAALAEKGARVFARVAVKGAGGGAHVRTPTSFCGATAWCRSSQEDARRTPVTLFVSTAHDALRTDDEIGLAPTLRASILDERVTWRNRIAVGEVALLPLLLEQDDDGSKTKKNSVVVTLVDPLTGARRGTATFETTYSSWSVREPSPSKAAALASLKDASSRKQQPWEQVFEDPALRELCPDADAVALARLVNALDAEAGREPSLEASGRKDKLRVLRDATLWRTWHTVLVTATLCATTMKLAKIAELPSSQRKQTTKHRRRCCSELVTFSIKFEETRTIEALRDQREARAQLARVIEPALLEKNIAGEGVVKCRTTPTSAAEARAVARDLGEDHRLRAALAASFGPCRLLGVRRVAANKRRRKPTSASLLVQAADAVARPRGEKSRVSRVEKKGSPSRLLDSHVRIAANPREGLVAATRILAADKDPVAALEEAVLKSSRREVRHLATRLEGSRDAAACEARAARVELEASREAPPSWIVAVRESAALEEARHRQIEATAASDAVEMRARADAASLRARVAERELQAAAAEVEKQATARRDADALRSNTTAELFRRAAGDAVASARRTALEETRRRRAELSERARHERSEIAHQRERAAERIQWVTRAWLGRRVAQRERAALDALRRAFRAFFRRSRDADDHARAAAAVGKIQAAARGLRTRRHTSATRRGAQRLGALWRGAMAKKKRRPELADVVERRVQQQTAVQRTLEERRRVRREHQVAALDAHAAALSSEWGEQARRDAAKRVVARRRRGLVLIAHGLVRLARRRLGLALVHWRRTLPLEEESSVREEEEVLRRRDRAERAGLAAGVVAELWCDRILEDVIDDAIAIGDREVHAVYSRLASEIVSNAVNTVLLEDVDESVEDSPLRATERCGSDWSSPTVYYEGPGFYFFEDDDHPASPR